MALNVVERIDELIRVEHVIISVFNKAGVVEFTQKLLEINPAVKIYSTGNTYALLKGEFAGTAGGNIIAVSAYTGQPEMQGGLVKTLDFKIYLGLLSETYNPAHSEDLGRVNGVAFDMVVSNLYPFTEIIRDTNTTAEIARSHIDIGGPCMIRAAAKNFIRVAAVTDITDYPLIVRELEANNGSLGLELRFELAKKAFLHTAQYDTAISEYLVERNFADIRSCYNKEN
jgi:phosphoribosylaminoimidazolecarboxamide formyltransferase/IMP cyclohydrolase